MRILNIKAILFFLSGCKPCFLTFEKYVRNQGGHIILISYLQILFPAKLQHVANCVKGVSVREESPPPCKKRVLWERRQVPTAYLERLVNLTSDIYQQMTTWSVFHQKKVKSQSRLISLSTDTHPLTYIQISLIFTELK